MLFGVFGLGLVFSGNLGAGNGAILGLAALCVAVIVQSLGLVWIKRINDDSPPLATTLGSLIVALPLFFAVWWAADGRLPVAWPERGVVATAYLGVFGSAIGFVLY